MRTPEEIKKGLELCEADECQEEQDTRCPYAENEFCVTHLFGDALAYITQLESRAPKWISVKDRLPNDNTLNIVFMRRSGNYGFCTFKIAAWVDGKWNGPCFPWEVTHWMPLPEPPKEDMHE